MSPSNYHTHTCFCDGKNTPEELVEEAIRLGCREIGFSGHAYTAFDDSFCMSKEDTRAYIDAVHAAQKTYGNRIKIWLGVEQDYYAEESAQDYDYVIGAVHYVKKDGCYLSVDESKETQIVNVARFYNGDFYSFVEDYYETMADVYRKTGCQIIGHFDLVAKFNRDQDLFDPQHPRYQLAAQKALDALMDFPVALEVNTGAIARGYTAAPYPAKDILRRWLAKGKKIVFSSDCHSAEQLLFGYDVYESYVQACR